MKKHEKINYLEIPSKNLKITKDFFIKAFNWNFVDYGSEYISFSNEDIDRGFYKSDLSISIHNGDMLIVFYSNNLTKTQFKIIDAGGLILKNIFDFPGGRRFHFADPNGNEYAVLSDN